MNKLAWLSIPQLTSCRLKIERADENILNLQSEIAAFLESKKNDVVSETDPTTGHGIVKFVGDLSAVRRFSVLSGEIAYHLRSSLDHLIWQLITNPADRSVNSCFPIYLGDPRKLSDPSVLRRYDRKVKGVTATAAAIIERIQPYNRKTPINDPLVILNRLSIDDKHHELVLSIVRVGVKALVFRDPPEQRILNLNEENALRWLGELKPGAELVRTINLIGTMNMVPEITLDIAFARVGLLQNEPVVPTLTNLRNAVADIIELFAKEKFV